MAEGTEVGTAYVSIVPSAAGFGAKLNTLITGQVTQTGQQAGQALGAGIVGQASGIARNVAGVFAAVGAGRFLKGSIAEAEDAARVGRLTASVIRSTGGAAGVTADQVEKLAGNLSKVAGIDDEVIQGGANVLLTFTKVRNEVGKGNDVFNRAAAAAVDMSAALGTDLQGSVIQLGKALNDPVQGLTALRRVGISFTEQQKEQIAAMQESGNLLGAQKIILEEVNREFGGAGAAGATASERLNVAIGNLQESIGGALLPAVEAGAGALTGMLGVFTDLPGPIQTTAVAIAGLGAASIAIGLLAPRLSAAREQLEGMGRAGTLAGRSLGLLGKVGLGVVAAGAVVEASDAIGNAITRIAAGPTAPANALTKSLVELGTTGKVTGELAKQLGDNLGGLGEKASEAATAGWVQAIARWNPSLQDSKRDIDSIDKALAGLVSSGHADVAGAALARLEQAIRTGPGGDAAAEKFVGNLGDYREALNGVDAQALLTGTSLDTTGDAADQSGDKAKEAARKWEDLRGEIEDLVASDWSKDLASSFESALNPLEKFTANAGKDVDGLRLSVQEASDDLAAAKAKLEELRGGDLDEISRDRTRATAAEITAAQHDIDQAAAKFNEAQKNLANAQKSPLTQIKENLTANLKVISDWQDDLLKLAGRGQVGADLAKHLGALGPEAAGAVDEATRQTDSQLTKLEGLFLDADTRITDAASGAFELNLDKARQPGENLANIIAKRYEETLAPKLTAATLAAIDQVVAATLGPVPPQPGTPPAAGPPRPGTSPPPALGPAAPPSPAAPLIDVPGFTYNPAGANKVVNVTINGPVPEPALLGKAIAWEL